MSEYLILHEVMIKTVIGYPLIIGIIGFSIFEMILENMVRKENKNEQYREIKN